MRDIDIMLHLKTNPNGRIARFMRAIDLLPAQEETEDGGKGSGNWGHKGRPGKRGGSGKGGGATYRQGSKEEGFSRRQLDPFEAYQRIGNNKSAWSNRTQNVGPDYTPPEKPKKSEQEEKEFLKNFNKYYQPNNGPYYTRLSRKQINVFWSANKNGKLKIGNNTMKYLYDHIADIGGYKRDSSEEDVRQGLKMALNAVFDHNYKFAQQELNGSMKKLCQSFRFPESSEILKQIHDIEKGSSSHESEAKKNRLSDKVIKSLQKMGAKRWIKGDDDRLYINDPEFYGLKVERYNTGNISHAELNGKQISHSAARAIMSSSFYIDNNTGKIFFYGNPPYKDDIIKSIRKSIDSVKQDDDRGENVALEETNLNGFNDITQKDPYQDQIIIPKSVGAKGVNYQVVDKQKGIVYHFVEGTRIQDAHTFAGYGGEKPLKQQTLQGLNKEYGTNSIKWAHRSGYGEINVDGESVRAEVHWFQQETIGKVKFKIKRWMK